MARCFIFKPDGIGDFFLSTGVIRLLAREFGEDNLTIAVLPALRSVVSGQFPKASVILLPLEKKRAILNVFVANCLRCFPSWLMLVGTRVDEAICLRHMRDYFQNILFFSIPSRRRYVSENLLLGNGRPVRRWTEAMFIRIFCPTLIPYPKADCLDKGELGLPTELEANRLLVSALLKRDVTVEEILPKLFPVKNIAGEGTFWVCAPFSSDPGKDFPTERWIQLLASLDPNERPDSLVLTGSSEQRARLEDFHTRILSELPILGVSPSVVMPPSLQDFIDLLAGADCVLTVDTAAAHAAIALDRRTLVLFSGQHAGMFAPWVSSPLQQWLLPLKSRRNEAWHAGLDNEVILAALSAVLGKDVPDQRSDEPTGSHRVLE